MLGNSKWVLFVLICADWGVLAKWSTGLLLLLRVGYDRAATAIAYTDLLDAWVGKVGDFLHHIRSWTDYLLLRFSLNVPLSNWRYRGLKVLQGQSWSGQRPSVDHSLRTLIGRLKIWHLDASILAPLLQAAPCSLVLLSKYRARIINIFLTHSCKSSLERTRRTSQFVTVTLVAIRLQRWLLGCLHVCDVVVLPESNFAVVSNGCLTHLKMLLVLSSFLKHHFLSYRSFNFWITRTRKSLLSVIIDQLLIAAHETIKITK